VAKETSRSPSNPPDGLLPGRLAPRERVKVLAVAIALVFATVVALWSVAAGLLAPATVTIILGICLVVICAALLRYWFSKEVYLLFLVFFGVAYVTLIIFIYLDRNNYIQGNDFFPWQIDGKKDGGLIANVASWYIRTSSDFPVEVAFLAAITGLIVIPQLLSFLASGLFGCARNPAFVSSIVKFSAISLMKCCCGFAAIELGTAIFILLKIHVEGKTFPFPENYFQSSVTFLSYAFLVAAGYYLYGHLVALIVRNDPTGLLKRAVDYMTKYAREEQALEAPSPLGKIAAALYGETWQASLEKELEAAADMVHQWATDEGRTPARMVREIETRCRDRGNELLRYAETLAKVIGGDTGVE
jgi:hypothetical protein